MILPSMMTRTDLPDQIQAVLFDLDGTLMDTDDQAVENLAHRLRRLRWPHPDRTARRLVMTAETPGNLVLSLLDVLGLDELAMSLTRPMRQRPGSDFRIVAGVAEMLAQLNGRYRLAIVTTRGQEEASAFLAQHHLEETFETVVTRESTRRLKPHPAPVQHAARLLDVPVERCVMVGDTVVDVQSARRAGAWTVAVLCGFGERRELERARAHLILEQTAHLASHLLPLGHNNDDETR
ncbi:MAG TPA: HAD family hydrolase [Chloroflexi bacterium]|nr:HAD family hydrolase [Chloroflexota bacterium]